MCPRLETNVSSPRKRGSKCFLASNGKWIPAFAGMTQSVPRE